MKEDEVLKLLTNHEVVVSGSEVYLSKKSAKELVLRCELEETRILGIDLFRVNKNSLVPIIDKIADFSQSPLFDSIELSKRFITLEMKESMYANFVVEDGDTGITRT